MYVIGMFEMKIFRFISKLLGFGFVSFRMNFLSDEFRFVMRSKPNRERLVSFRVTNMLYTRAALTQMRDDGKTSKYFEKKFSFV